MQVSHFVRFMNKLVIRFGYFMRTGIWWVHWCEESWLGAKVVRGGEGMVVRLHRLDWEASEKTNGTYIYRYTSTKMQILKATFLQRNLPLDSIYFVKQKTYTASFSPSLYIYIYIYIYICVCVYIYISVCVCVCVCAYSY